MQEKGAYNFVVYSKTRNAVARGLRKYENEKGVERTITIKKDS